MCWVIIAYGLSDVSDTVLLKTNGEKWLTVVRYLHSCEAHKAVGQRAQTRRDV